VRELIDFRELNYYGTSFETLWRAYMEYQAEVASAASAPLSLADKNRYLRGESAALRLEDEISRLFSKRAATPKTPRRRRASRA
jgi:hypothetical protein